MNKAVFLDRDGILNKERGEYTYLLKDFELVSGVKEALKFFMARDYKLIVITNQSGIAREVYTHNDVKLLHDHMLDELAKEGIEILEIYYCPHHPETGKCLCRKPDSLLLEKAIARFNINPSLSFFIGDRERDMQAAEKVGIKGILIESNHDLREVSNLFIL